MTRSHIIFTLTAAVISALSCGVGAAPLISAEEASLPDAPFPLMTRGISRGPSIKQISPAEGDSVKSPLTIKVNFVPHGGARVDPETVRVTYHKVPAVDLTSRLREAISASGITLTDTQLPSGQHMLKVTVKDSNGRETSSVLTVRVDK